MSKDYTTVDVRDIKHKGVAFVKEADSRCKKAMDKVIIWTEKAIPHILYITQDQFKILAALRGDPNDKPTGKEIFQTSNGYVMEIKVESEEL